jgi:hypothetical protein
LDEDEGLNAQLKAAAPMHRGAEPEEMAGMVLFARTGTHADVELQAEFNRDLKQAAATALATTNRSWD